MFVSLEPVLVKRSSLHYEQLGPHESFSIAHLRATHGVAWPEVYDELLPCGKKRTSFPSVSSCLCLSRACLGKRIVSCVCINVKVAPTVRFFAPPLSVTRVPGSFLGWGRIETPESAGVMRICWSCSCTPAFSNISAPPPSRCHRRRSPPRAAEDSRARRSASVIVRNG